MSINVLAIDDSALVRKVIADIISSVNDIVLVDTAFDPIFAIPKLKKDNIDVVILDIEMPRMDGLTFLEKLMKAKPTPVIILSSLTTKNANISLQALELGAFAVLTKPMDILELPEMKQSVIDAIRSAGHPSVRDKLIQRFNKSSSSLKPVQRHFTATRSTTDKIIVLGSSTGGTTAIMDILSELPVDIPGIVIVQHMPLKFSQAFADRLDKNLGLSVKLAKSGEQIKNGHVYIAPGDQHCSVISSGAKYLIQIKEGPKVHYHRPSVAVLFNSAANYCGRNVIGVLLTGMGDDGSKAMLKMKEAGSYNIIQDEKSSVVWGMPGKAFEFNAHHIVVPLNNIAQEICNYINNGG
ncbi:MAG: chemotaxis response regulator protein-glutamate methylesterase [Spirochaetaceae bacterium]